MAFAEAIFVSDVFILLCNFKLLNINLCLILKIQQSHFFNAIHGIDFKKQNFQNLKMINCIFSF